MLMPGPAAPIELVQNDKHDHSSVLISGLTERKNESEPKRVWTYTSNLIFFFLNIFFSHFLSSKPPKFENWTTDTDIVIHTDEDPGLSKGGGGGGTASADGASFSGASVGMLPQ